MIGHFVLLLHFTFPQGELNAATIVPYCCRVGTIHLRRRGGRATGCILFRAADARMQVFEFQANTQKKPHHLQGSQ
jgi:hypothetical protein